MANDDQLFMMLGHELAHLEAGSLHATQAEKNTIRAAEETERRAEEDLDALDDEPGCGDEEEDPYAFPSDPEKPKERRTGFMGTFVGELLCEAGRRVIPIGTQVFAGAVGSAAWERLSLIESQMDARALELGLMAGYDRAEMMSTFHLLSNAPDTSPFLVERTRRLSSISGIDRVSIRIPEGRVPIELADSLDTGALALLHNIGRNRKISPERRIRQINALVAKIWPIYQHSAAFQRGYYSYQIGYGGLIGINPATLRNALEELQPGSAGGLVGEVWIGCEALRIRSPYRTEVRRLRTIPSARLGQEVRQSLLNSDHVEKVRECATDS
ncbi:MAG: hypothetical protein AAF479_15510 [Pseudomonadota bacterium]